MTGLFKSLFSYRQRENNSPLENFLSELLAYCLRSDKQFRRDFFSQILNISDVEASLITTQNDYEEFGRPDIEIETQNTVILIESKLDAAEGINQIDRYVNILKLRKENDKQKIVVYLTKHFREKKIFDNEVKLVCSRWYQVHKLITDKNTEISQEFKRFLTEQNMDKNFNFSVAELHQLQSIHVTFEKMDELLNKMKDPVKSSFGGFSTSASRSSSLSDNVYQNYVDLKYKGLPYRLYIGFTWFESDPSVWLGLEFHTKKFQIEKELKKILDKELINNNWTFGPYEGYWYYYQSRPIKDFKDTKKDQVTQMAEYLEKHLDTLINIKTKYKLTGILKK